MLNLNACAFKLRGQNELPPDLRVMYLDMQDPYSSFTATVSKTLRSSGITLVDSPQQAKVVLRIDKPVLSSRLVTIGTSNQSRVYNVVYASSFTLSYPKGKSIIPPGRLSASRNLTLSPNQLIESNNQLPLLQREMERDLISQLLNQLTSEQVAQALQSPVQPPRN